MKKAYKATLAVGDCGYDMDFKFYHANPAPDFTFSPVEEGESVTDYGDSEVSAAFALLGNIKVGYFGGGGIPDSVKAVEEGYRHVAYYKDMFENKITEFILDHNNDFGDKMLEEAWFDYQNSPESGLRIAFGGNHDVVFTVVAVDAAEEGRKIANQIKRLREQQDLVLHIVGK